MHFATHLAARARRQTLALITSSVLSAAALLLTPASYATTTGSSNAASEVRAASGFQAIALLSSIDLVVRQGNSEGVMVRADDNILPLVQTSVEGSGDARTLRSQVKAGEPLRPKTPAMVTVDVVRLNALASSGSGNITIEALKAPMLTVSIY